MPRLKHLTGLRRLLHARLLPEQAPGYKRSTLVLAPHQDDETLGCGGTIILKRNAGARVTVAFMTDGTTSHRQFMSESELRTRRYAEAIDACEILGVPRTEVHFLGHPDGKLEHRQPQAITEVARLIDACHPDEIFVPYEYDGTADHEATCRIAQAALSRVGHSARVFEYPIWIWNRWPWVQLKLAINRDCMRAAAQACSHGLGVKAIRAFRCGVRIDGVLDRKRRALLRHRTQMSVVVAGVPWPTLADVTGGDFLECFFHDHEVFRCRDYPAPQVHKAAPSLISVDSSPDGPRVFA